MNTARRTTGFSVLELMIALALLATLMAVAWSILGSYRTAEERGWAQSYRMRVSSVARVWLESDVDHGMVGDRGDRGATIGDSSASTWRQTFRGTQRGFRWEQLPSVDPLPWLDDVTRGLESVALASDDRDIGADEQTHSPRIVDPWVLRTVTYRLEPEGSLEDGLVVFRLSRELTGEDPWNDAKVEKRSAERELTSEDLYRQSDEGLASSAEAYVERQEALRYLVAPRFRYFDGHQWSTSWDGQLRGGLPAAIELSFDFPPASSPFDPALRFQPADEFELADASVEKGSENGVGDSAIVGGDTKETATEGETERDVRIVVRVSQSDLAWESNRQYGVAP